MMMRQGLARGISLVELMVVVAVLGILVAVAIPAMNDFIERRRIEGVMNELQSDFALMRAEALGRPGKTLKAILAVGASGSQTCYSLYWNTDTGDVVCDCRKPPGSACTSKSRPWAEIKVVKIPEHYGLRLVPKPIPVATLSDQARTFSPNGFQIQVEGKGSAKLRIEVDGRANTKVCSPEGKMGGYESCA